MATLRYSQIRAHPGGTIRYIANKNKIISSKVHDVYNVLNYMGEPESTERVYAFGHHCSTNPALAEKQVALHRARYFESKKGGVQGLADGADELLGLHFFMSYSEADDPSEATMNDISMKLSEHPLFNDFAFFGANHFDKKHKHTHFFVSQYSAEGKPRKLCMRHEDYNDLRRYANRLCVEHGLSIIDLGVLRNDPEYSAWIDGVIAEGKVIIHPESEEHKHNPHQKVPTKNLYYKWLKQTEEFNAEQEKLLTSAQLSRKRAAETYFWTLEPKEKPPKYYPVSGRKNKYYTVRMYDEHGRKRSLLELTIMLIAVIYENEKKYMEAQDPRVLSVCKARVDPKVQGMMDCIRTAREVNVEHPRDIPARIADVGKQMNALKREKARHENSIRKHEEIISAWEVYERVRPAVEGVCEPEEAVLSEYKSAYAVLAKNQIFTAEAFAELHHRYLFERRKVGDYEKRLPQLKRQYRDLKRMEALACRPVSVVDEIYRCSQSASQYKNAGLDDMIEAAEAKSSPKTEKVRGDDLRER